MEAFKTTNELNTLLIPSSLLAACRNDLNMTKCFFLLVCFLAFIHCTSAGIAQAEEDESVLTPDERVEFIRGLYAYVSVDPFDCWLFEFIEAELEQVRKLQEKDPRTGVPSLSSLFTLKDKFMEGILAPGWFTEFQDFLEERKKLPKDERPEYEEGFADNVPNWFRTWFDEVKGRVKAAKQENKA